MNVSSLRLQKEGKEEGKKEERRVGGTWERSSVVLL